MLSMIWSATQPANSKSARKKKKQPKTPNVLLSVHLRIARPPATALATKLYVGGALAIENNR
jgi:hypothetical protein